MNSIIAFSRAGGSVHSSMAVFRASLLPTFFFRLGNSPVCVASWPEILRPSLFRSWKLALDLTSNFFLHVRVEKRTVLILHAAEKGRTVCEDRPAGTASSALVRSVMAADLEKGGIAGSAPEGRF
jgi:hypothetical protein